MRYIDLCYSSEFCFTGPGGELLEFRKTYDSKYEKKLELIEYSNRIGGTINVKYTSYDKKEVEELVKELWNFEVTISL